MTREAPALLHILQADDMRGQILRFGITGGLSTLIYSAVYLPLTLWVFAREHAVYAVPPAFAVAVIFGYVMHSRWSFKDRAPNGAAPASSCSSSRYRAPAWPSTRW